MNQVQLALLGVGRWGTHLLRNFLAHRQVQIRAVADPSASRLTAVAQQFQLGGSVVLTADWSQAIALDGLDAVVIATPAATHAALVAAALKQNLHVLCEKPLTESHSSALALGQLARQRQRQLMVDHTYLFHPAVVQGAKSVAQLGTLRYGYAARTNLGPVRQDVDVIWDLAIHDIAIFNHWLGITPTQVQAQGQSWLQKSLADVAWCRLRYPSGFEARLQLSWANPFKQRQLYLVGDQGALIFDEMHPQSVLTLQQGCFSPQGFQPQALPPSPVAVEAAEPLARLCDRFIQGLISGQPCQRSSGVVGARLVQILEALSHSQRRDGRWINLTT